MLFNNRECLGDVPSNLQHMFESQTHFLNKNVKIKNLMKHDSRVVYLK